MRSHNLVLATLAVLTDLGAVAAPVHARGVNDANENPSSLQILSNKIPSNFRLEASALVLPSPQDAEEQQASQGSGVELIRTGDAEDKTVLRTHDVVPLGRQGGSRNSTLMRPLLAGAGGQASPLAGAAQLANPAPGLASTGSGGRGTASGGEAPLPFARAGGNGAEALPLAGDGATAPPEKRAEGPLAGVQELPGQAVKLSNAPVPGEVVGVPADAVQQAATALPDGPSPAGAVSATKDFQDMPAQAMAAAGGMIPAAAAASPQQKTKHKRGTTRVELPAVDVDRATAETNALGLQVFQEEDPSEQKRGTTRVGLPAVHADPSTAETNALGLQVFGEDEPRQKRGTTRVGLPAVDVDRATAETSALGLQVFEGPNPQQKRGGTSVTLPAAHADPTTAETDALGLRVLERNERRDRENTAEGCRRHGAELGPNRNNNDNNNNGNNGPAVVQLRPVAQVEPVASLRPAADIRLPTNGNGNGDGNGNGNSNGGGLGLARTLGLQRRQVFVNLPRPRPRPSDFVPPIVVAPQVRPAVGLQRRRAMRRGERAAAE